MRKNKTRTFSRQFLADVVSGNSDAVIVSEEIVDHRRWAVRVSTVFSYDGAFYRTSYDRGATERQDTLPFEGENDLIDVEEVRKVEVISMEWRPVEAEA